MNNKIASCEKKISCLLGRKHCILTGRGATALWLAYNLAGPKQSKIILPAILCLSPVFTVLYAGKIPIFADVQNSDATLDPAAVEEMLSEDPDISAVVAVHLFGHPASMHKLERICSKFGVMLIEDLAPALGGADRSGNLFGSKGDISILSFGHTKILDVGGGGALLTDNDDIEGQARELMGKLSDEPENSDELSNIYSRIFYAIWESARVDERFYSLFDQFPELFKPLYLYPIASEQAKRIERSLDLLPQEISHRKKIANIYSEAFTSCSQIRLFRLSGMGVPWRFCFRVSVTTRDKLIEEVRMKGFDISSWYPNIKNWNPHGRAQRFSCPVAEQLENEIVNLWVTQEYSSEKASSLAKLIRRILKENAKTDYNT